MLLFQHLLIRLLSPITVSSGFIMTWWNSLIQSTSARSWDLGTGPHCTHQDAECYRARCSATWPILFMLGLKAPEEPRFILRGAWIYEELVGWMKSCMNEWIAGAVIWINEGNSFCPSFISWFKTSEGLVLSNTEGLGQTRSTDASVWSEPWDQRCSDVGWSLERLTALNIIHRCTFTTCKSRGGDAGGAIRPAFDLTDVEKHKSWRLNRGLILLIFNLVLSVLLESTSLREEEK